MKRSKRKMSFFNSVKNFIGMGDEEEYEDEEFFDEEFEEEEYDEEPKRKFTAFPRKPKVVPINSAATSKVRIIKARSNDEATKIADETKAGRLVIFDVTGLDTEDARRIVDFMSGAAYALDGNVRRIAGGIFVAAPRNIDITSDNFKEQSRTGFDWNV